MQRLAAEDDPPSVTPESVCSAADQAVEQAPVTCPEG
jgi:hypothetical protein